MINATQSNLEQLTQYACKSCNTQSTEQTRTIGLNLGKICQNCIVLLFATMLPSSPPGQGETSPRANLLFCSNLIHPLRNISASGNCVVLIWDFFASLKGSQSFRGWKQNSKARVPSICLGGTRRKRKISIRK